METILLVLALSLDAFVASIAYGTNKIKIPFKSITIINLICALSLAISIFFGTMLKRILPANLTTIISFIILALLGFYYLFESIIKSFLKKKSPLNEKVKFKLFNIWFIIDIYIDETKADLDKSKILNSKEAIYLATALSLDSIAIGFGSGLGSINYLNVIVLSLVFHMFALLGGLYIGERFISNSKVNLSWLAGVILIFLAFLKLI